MDGYKSTRYLLLFFNIIIFLCGSTLLAAGLLFKLDSGFLSTSVVAIFNTVIYDGMPPFGVTCDALSYIMSCVGGIMIATAILGMCGALKSAKACLWVFIVLAVMFIVLQSVMIGLWIAVRTKTDEWLRGQMLTLLADYAGPEETDTVSKGWNALFMEARCCGVNAQYADGGTTNDFLSVTSAWTVGPDKVPASCCQGATEGNVAGYVNSATCTTTPVNFYTEGCYSRVKFYIETYSLVAMIAGGVAILAQVLAVVASCVVIDKARHRVANINPDGNKPPPYIAIGTSRRTRTQREDRY